MNKYFKESNINHNIYSSNDSINNEKYYGDLIESRFNKNYTNIYGKKPNDMKTYSNKVIDKDNLEFFTAKEAIEKKESKIDKSKWKTDDLHNDNIANGDLLDYQFGEMKFDSKGEISHNGNDNAMGLFDIRDKRTYGIVDEDKMTHNNMVPEFKLKGNYGLSPDDEKHLNDTFTRKLNLFTGSLNSLDYRKKTERKPLFAPVPGLSNIYDSPVKTESYKGRYIPGRERRNEKPFQEVKVTPGLNLGYNEVGIQGFHDLYRAMPRNIDQTRTLNNPKITYNNPMGGQLVKKVVKEERLKKNDYLEHFSQVDADNILYGEYETEGINGFYAPGGGSRSVDPVVYKRRPDRFKYYGDERMIETSAYRNKPANYGSIDKRNLATINRGTKDTTYAGHLQSNQGHIIGGEVESSREQYLHDGPTNVTDNKQNYTVNYSNITPNPTKRNTYNYEDNGITTGDNRNYTINYKNQTPNPTKRNTYNYEDNGITTGDNKNYAINYSNIIPDPTRRNTYNVNDSGNTTGDNRNYTINYKNQTPDPTRRNTYNVNDSGNTSGYSRNYIINYSNLTPNPTNRDMYKVVDSNKLATGIPRNYIINYELATPDPTDRDIHKVKDIFSHAKGHNDNYVINYELATPDPTNRDIHKVKDSFTSAKGHDNNYVINYELATPDPTDRDIHKVKDSFRGAKGHDNNYVINYELATPDPTDRDIHKVKDSFSGAKGYNQSRSRLDANNSRQNIIKDKCTIKPHGPVKCNYEKIPTMENTIMTSSYHKLQINRELYPDIDQKVAGMDYPQIYDKQTLPNDEFHFNSYVLDNLQGNPYVNDTQLKSEYVLDDEIY